jgi:hypothetical protein
MGRSKVMLLPVSNAISSLRCLGCKIRFCEPMDRPRASVQSVSRLDHRAGSSEKPAQSGAKSSRSLDFGRRLDKKAQEYRPAWAERAQRTEKPHASGRAAKMRVAAPTNDDRVGLLTGLTQLREHGHRLDGLMRSDAEAISHFAEPRILAQRLDERVHRIVRGSDAISAIEQGEDLPASAARAHED